MAHTDTHRISPGKQSADRSHESHEPPREKQKEQASREADTGAAPEQADTRPDTVNPKARRSDQAEK